MKKKQDIFSLIKADHRKVEEIFDKLEKTTEKAVAKREKLYSDLQSELRNHTLAEEEAIYPNLKDNDKTEAIGYESVEEHSIVKFLLEKLDKTPCNAPEFTAQITALKEAVKHHVEEEEEEMFPKMKKTFSKEELNAFAEDFKEVKAASMEKKTAAAA